MDDPRAKAYLKIGIYMSVVTCSVPPDASCDLRFDNASLKFAFKDSGEKSEDGIPIWVAESVNIDG